MLTTMLKSLPASSLRRTSVQFPARRASTLCQAKKGGKNKNVKKGSLLPKTRLQPWQSTDLIMQHLLMVESYRRALGTPLLTDMDIESISQVMWEAPQAILAHNKGSEGPGEEVVYTFANKRALEVFEAEWEDLVGKPSTVTMPDDAAAIEARAALLDDTVTSGSTQDYKGLRVSLKGKPFEICEATLWNIVSPKDDSVLGQACVFNKIKLEDGREYTLGETVEGIPQRGDIEGLEAEVAAVAQRVRSLKEVDGLTNADQQVKDAVEELLAIKTKLQQMKDHVEQVEAAAAQAKTAADPQTS